MTSTGGWGFHQLQPQAPIQPFHPPSHPLAAPPRRLLFQPKPAEVQPSQGCYPRASLLGIALEIRHQIWQEIHNQIESERATLWSAKPKTDFDALPLVCRQVYEEIQDFWHRSIIPSNRLQSFLDQPLRISKLQGFYSLSIEIPFEVSTIFISHMTDAIGILAPYLESLQMFWTGVDAYGTGVYLHGCGNELPEAASRDVKLPQDGQAFELRHPLVNALATLKNLRTLTVSNLNLPLLQQHLIKNKPYLQRLCVVTDPRTTLHMPWRRKYCGVGLMLPVSENFPPVKELYLSANSIVGSVQVPWKLSLTLEKLTWVVPNVARQAGTMSPHWHHETSTILQSLRGNSKRLHTLRLCMEGYFYEGNVSYGDLIGAFKEHVPRILNLKKLELHLWSKSPFIAREFIVSLPRSLERFYVSDRFVHDGELLKLIEARYMPGVLKYGPYARTLDGSDEAGETEIIPSTEAKRADHISLRRGNLGFVAYEYNESTNQRFRIIESSTGHGHVEQESVIGLRMLFLNARLLDLERNRHIAAFEPGMDIPPLLEFTNSRATTVGQLRSFLDIPPHYRRDSRSAADVKYDQEFGAAGELKTTEDADNNFHFRNKSYDAYFGDEDEAQIVFAAERARPPDVLPTLKYPIVITRPTGYENHEHWMCP